MIVYIAGPLRATDRAGLPVLWRMAVNMGAAWGAAVRLWRAGHVPVVPHLLTLGMGGAVAESRFMDGMIEVLKRCDAVVLVHRWRQSPGTLAEIRAAGDAGIPVFRSVADLRRGVARPAAA
jgi:hypothetical protein